MCESNLCVPHARCCYQSLLQSFVLQSAVLLRPLLAPVQLQQVLDDLWVAPQSRMHQGTLPALIDMINLEGRQRGSFYCTETQCSMSAPKDSFKDHKFDNTNSFIF